jgi:hypothetical protein
MLAAAHLTAETPQDSLVMAFGIDDLITLDPAEVFEFTGAEYAANVYDRRGTYPPDALDDLRGHMAESWEIADECRQDPILRPVAHVLRLAAHLRAYTSYRSLRVPRPAEGIWQRALEGSSQGSHL